MKKLLAGLLMAATTVVLPVAIAPASNAVCGDVSGRHVAVGGCSHVVGDVAAGVAVSDDDDWAAQAATGQTPCYTPSGVPYYTPGSDPCY